MFKNYKKEAKYMSAPIDDLVHKVSLIIDYINGGKDEEIFIK